jgi:hypothetical protein
VRTETVEVDERFGKEYAGTYVFREITGLKRDRIITRYTKYSPTGAVLSSDIGAIRVETLWASLKEQPSNKPLTLEKLLNEDADVPQGLTNLFHKTVSSLNEVSLEEKKNS